MPNESSLSSQAPELSESDKELRQLVRLFSALSTETRLKLFITIATSPCAVNVGTLAKVVRIKDSAASQNLRILEDAGLLLGFTGGTYKLYVVHESVSGKIERFLQYIVSAIKVVTTQTGKEQGDSNDAMAGTDH